MNFVDRDDEWTDLEIEVIDRGFDVLQQRTGNTRLLKDTFAEGPLTFYKHLDLDNAAALNLLDYDGNTESYFREIQFADWNEQSDFENDFFALTAVHEIAHNWDEAFQLDAAQEGLGDSWQDFLDLSGWQEHRSRNHQRADTAGWWHLRTASFSESYGRTNPFEDSATMWEYYFLNGAGSSTQDHGELQAKYEWVDRLMDTVANLA